MTTYKQFIDMSYDDYVAHLLKKYGPVPYDYFLDEDYSRTAGKLITRTKDGLEVHHIDENKYLLLSDGDACRMQGVPFECQKAERLVYADKVEHLLLHIKIILEYVPHGDWVERFLCGPAFIIRSTNELYNYVATHKQVMPGWKGNMTKKIIKKYREYLYLLYGVLTLTDYDDELLEICLDGCQGSRIQADFNKLIFEKPEVLDEILGKSDFDL